MARACKLRALTLQHLQSGRTACFLPAMQA